MVGLAGLSFGVSWLRGQGGDPDALVMLLFFLVLPVSIVVGIVSSALALLRGRAMALLPLGALVAAGALILRFLFGAGG